MQKPSKKNVWRAALPISACILLLAICAPLPVDVRAVMVGGLVLGWTLAAGFWAVQRYGAWVSVPIAAVTVLIGGFAGYFYWLDEPNRQALTEVKQLRISHVRTSGKFYGPVESVWFDQYATDDDLQRFLTIDGLDGLKEVVLDNTPIRDETAKKLIRFTSLERLRIEGVTLQNATYDFLSQNLPDCRIDVR